MTKYYILTDKSYQIYAAATFLNPTQRRDFFDNSWIAHLAPYNNKKKKKKKKRDTFEEWLYRKKEEDTVADEFRRYSVAGSAIPTTKRFDPIA